MNFVQFHPESNDMRTIINSLWAIYCLHIANGFLVALKCTECFDFYVERKVSCESLTVSASQLLDAKVMSACVWNGTETGLVDELKTTVSAITVSFMTVNFLT